MTNAKLRRNGEEEEEKNGLSNTSISLLKRTRWWTWGIKETLGHGGITGK